MDAFKKQITVRLGLLSSGLCVVCISLTLSGRYEKPACRRLFGRGLLQKLYFCCSSAVSKTAR